MALNLEDVGSRVDEVIGMDGRGDVESAHLRQDRIYVDVLRAVADGHPDAQDMAAEALRIAETGGERWYS